MGYHQDFSIQEHLKFTTNDWVVWKGPILTSSYNKWKIKIEFCELTLEKDTSGDTIFYEIGVCCPDYSGLTLAWDETIWSFSAGLNHGLFHKDFSRSGWGVNMKIGDVLTMIVDLNRKSMWIQVNDQNFGLAFNNIHQNVCFAVSARCNLELKFLDLVPGGMRMFQFVKKKNNLNVYFYFK